MSIKFLKTNIDQLMSKIKYSKEKEVFDLMVFRDLAKRQFWNCIIHFIDYDFPYDLILPYKTTQLIQNFKFSNRHINVICSVKPEGDKFPKKIRRHKSEDFITQFDILS
mmetsp:Transcript_5307/g.4491  ORF Transcript_5307/g.4491 Transcript_5307/m.4491 type:complete len:109 (+) Transcript_5307:699-1025(+)